MEIPASLAAITAKRDEYKAMIKDAGKAAMSEALQAFFAAHPQVRSINWRQYTPHFNDGEPCTFGIRGTYVVPVAMEGGDEDDCGDYELGYLSYHVGKDDSKWVTAQLAKDGKQVDRMLNDNEEILQEAFGDGVKVIASASGIEVEEYDHD